MRKVDFFNLRDLLFFDRFKLNYIRINFKDTNIDLIYANKHVRSMLSDDFLVGCIFFNNKKNIKSSDLKSLKDRGINKDLEVFFSRSQKDEFQLLSIINGNKDDIPILNNIIFDKDFSIFPILYIDIFYIDMRNKMILNIYDDRGMDIFYFSKKKYEEVISYLSGAKIDFTKFN